MALNINTFKTRSLTAIVFAVVMLGGLLWNFWSFLVLFSIIHIGCWIELIQLRQKIYGHTHKIYSLIGLIYISLPLLLLFDLATRLRYTITDGVFYSPLLPCAIIFSIWINDTMAYIVGSSIGKTPFSGISPKKTWEGTLGGILLSVGTIALIAYFTKLLPVSLAVSISFLCAVFGTAGDLLESKIKRLAGVKDSGKIMPGHGGFLDRFDSLLVATPAVWLLVEFFI